jgi:hypothetical protein
VRTLDAPEGPLVLTLANAAVVLNREPVTPLSLGYTRTMHHSSLIQPGDLWRPAPHEHPHVVHSIDHSECRLTITDVEGQTFRYPTDGLMPTAVVDSGPPRVRLPRTWARRPSSRRRSGRGSEPDTDRHQFPPFHDTKLGRGFLWSVGAG